MAPISPGRGTKEKVLLLDTVNGILVGRQYLKSNPEPGYFPSLLTQVFNYVNPSGRKTHNDSVPTHSAALPEMVLRNVQSFSL